MKETPNKDTWNPIELYKQISGAHSDLQGLNVSKEDALVGTLGEMSFNDPIATPELTSMSMYATTAVTDTINPWDSFKAGFESTVGESIKSAGMIDDYIKAERTPNYSGVDSPIYQNASEEYKMQYGHVFATSPNEEWTKKLAERITKYEDLNKVSSANFWSGLVGATVGGVLDPGTLVAMSGGVILRSAKLAAMGYTYSELRSTVDPTYASDFDANADAAIMTAVLGNAFHYLGSSAGLFKKGYNDYWTNRSEEPSIKLTDLSTGKSTGAMATKSLDSQDYRVAKTNFIHKFLYNTFKPFSAEYRLFDSDINATRQFSAQFLEPNNRAIKEVGGTEVKPISVVELRESEAAKMKTKVYGDLDNQYIEHRKAGGRLTQEEFDIAAGEYLQHGRSDDQAIIQSVKGWSEVWDKNWKSFKDLNIVEKDAISERKSPFYANREYIDKHPAEFDMDVEKQVRQAVAKRNSELKARIDKLEETKAAKETANVKSAVIKEIEDELTQLNKAIEDPVETKRIAKELANQMLQHADGRLVVHGNFKAQTLQKVKFDWDPEFRLKYGVTNLRTIINRYSHEAGTAKVLQERFGTQDVVNLMFNKIDDEVAIKSETILNDPTLSTAKKNEMYGDLLKIAARDKEDLTQVFEEAIGKRFIDYSRVGKSIASSIKGIVGLQSLGNRVVGNLSDLAHAQLTHAPIRALGEHAYAATKEVIKSLKPLSQKQLREFAVMIDDITQEGASRGVLDDGTTAYSTATERFIQKGMEIYNKVQLFTATQNKMRQKTFNNIASDILEWSAALVDNKLDPKSYEAMQLRKYGISKSIAKNIMSEFDKHHTVDNGVADLQLGAWDWDTQRTLAGAVKQRLNNKLVGNTPGATANFLSNPYLSVLTQFQKFVHLSVGKLLIPAIQDLSGVHPKAAIAALTTIAADMFLGVMRGQLRSMMSGNDDTELTPSRAIIYALEGSAMFAMAGFISNTLDASMSIGAANLLGEKEYSRYQKNNLASLLGPAAGKINDLVNIGGAAIHDNMTTSEWLALKRLMPFNNFFMYNWYLNQMIKENT